MKSFKDFIKASSEGALTESTVKLTSKQIKQVEAALDHIIDEMEGAEYVKGFFTQGRGFNRKFDGYVDRLYDEVYTDDDEDLMDKIEDVLGQGVAKWEKDAGKNQEKATKDFQAFMKQQLGVNLK